MEYNLVCVHPFAHYTKGQVVSDQDEVKKLLIENEQNFVRVAAPKKAPIEQEIAPRSENKNSRKG